MFGRGQQAREQEERVERARLQELSEKDLMIEMLIELKRIDRRCQYIARKIGIYIN